MQRKCKESASYWHANVAGAELSVGLFLRLTINTVPNQCQIFKEITRQDQRVGKSMSAAQK
jgi:hypothetical protein